MNDNVKQRMRSALYALKRTYGGRIDIYKKGNVTSNARTGERTIAKTVTPVKRAIILPAEVARQEVRGISLISANKGLVQGGWYDNSLTYFIIEQRDAPDLTLTPDDWIVCSGKKYQIDEFRQWAFDTCWVVTAKALLGEVPEQIFSIAVHDILPVSDEAVEE